MGLMVHELPPSTLGLQKIHMGMGMMGGGCCMGGLVTLAGLALAEYLVVPLHLLKTN